MTNKINGNGLGDAAEQHALTKRWNYLGAGLIALAFIGPSLVTVAGVGVGNAFSFGESIGRTFGSLAVLMLIAWLVTRKMSGLAQAKARVVVGIVLCVIVGNNIAKMAKEEDVAKAFVRDALAFQAQQQEKFEHFGKRFDEVTVADYMSAEALVSPAGVVGGKAALEKFRSLLQERNLLLQTYLAESAALIARIPAGKARAGAESSYGPIKEATEKLYKKLDRVQSEQSAAIGAIFDWAAANNGKLGANNGELVFSSVDQQLELQALVIRLQAIEDEVDSAFQEAEEMEAAELVRQERLKDEAAEFLAK